MNGKIIMAMAATMLATSIASGITFFSDNFETDKGWTFGGNSQHTWIRGTPVGGSGTGPDPVGAYQGNYCIGNNITALANYAYASSETSYAVSPKLDLSGTSLVYLHFYRWLCTKGSSNTVCSLEVSNNGTTWTGFFGNPNPALDDAAWQYLTYDISSVAANQANVYVRFLIKDSGANPPRHGGWNIDNIVVDDNLLAVSLSSFACSLIDGVVVLSWRTESEQDCYQWRVERSVEQGTGYRAIATVAGSGTTGEPHDYSVRDQAGLQPGVYYYRLAEIGNSGTRTLHGPVSIEYRQSARPEFQAGPAWPNPARDQATVSLQLPHPGMITGAVYNLAGQKVRDITGGTHPAGALAVSCDGRDGRGQDQPSGVYLFRLNYRPDDGAGNRQTIVNRLILAR